MGAIKKAYDEGVLHTIDLHLTPCFIGVLNAICNSNISDTRKVKEIKESLNEYDEVQNLIWRDNEWM